MGRKRGPERVLGPYPHARGWQVKHILPASEPGGEGEARFRFFASQEDAERYANVLRADIVRSATTIDEALDAYEKHLIQKGNKPNSYRETLRRMRRFFPTQTFPLDMLTKRTCERYYEKLAETMAVDSHRNYLAEARSFLKWIVQRGWLPRNPLDGVEGKGKRRHGKAQLRLDEARRWLARAEAMAAENTGPVAAMMTLLLGLRASEVVNRQVRDVDDDCRLLWIPDTKTEAGRRTLEIPDQLRAHLHELIKGRHGDAYLFPSRQRGKHRDRKWPATWVKAICQASGVPLVTAHGMRGLHGTLAVAAGATSHLVAQSLGHESFATTARSYARPEVVDSTKRAAALSLLKGGKK